MTPPGRPAIVFAMIGTQRIEGYAIVSADGMIADAGGAMPASIRNDADQKFLQAELDLRRGGGAWTVIRYEGGPRAARRKRLIVTRRIACHRAGSVAAQYAPCGIRPGRRSNRRIADARRRGAGTIAIIGGTEVFGLFLPRYRRFPPYTRRPRQDSWRTAGLSANLGPQVTPEESPRPLTVCRPGPRRDIDAAAGITLTTW
jgi:hypothetical protein